MSLEGNLNSRSLSNHLKSRCKLNKCIKGSIESKYNLILTYILTNIVTIFLRKLLKSYLKLVTIKFRVLAFYPKS